MPTDTAALVCSAYQAMKPRWDICRAVRGGTEVLCRTEAATYLPRWEAETIKDWGTRQSITFAYDAFSQGENALIGLALRHGVELGDDVPERIILDWEDIDGQGTHGDIFAQYVLGDALVDGHAGILTEFPVLQSGMTLEEEAGLGIRAYFVRVRAQQIINWRTIVYGGQQRLALLVIKEDSETEDGSFGAKTVTRYRVYRQHFRTRDRFGNSIQPYVTYQVFTEEKAGVSRPQLIAGEVGEIRGPPWIPFAPVYGGQQEGLLLSRPPLLGLAYTNIDHTQIKSERRISQHLCSVPWRVITGVDPKDETPIVVSATAATKLGQGAAASILEPAGNALADLRQELIDLEKRMALQSGAMLDPDSAGEPATTATEARIVHSQKESKLARAVRSLEDGLEAGFGFMAAYYNLEDGGSVTIRRDFGDFLSADQHRVLSEARARGDLTLETWLRVIKMAGMLPNDVEATAEAEAVRKEMGTEPGTEPATSGMVA